MKKILKTFRTNDMSLLYLLDTETQVIGLTLLPRSLEKHFMIDGCWQIESLVQLKRVGDSYPDGFSNGHTLRNSETCLCMKFKEQRVHEDPNGSCRVETILESSCLQAKHFASFSYSNGTVTIYTELKNTGNKIEKLEMLSSFSLCSLFGFDAKSRTDDFTLHRLRSKWSEEGRIESRSFLELQLEPSWARCGVQSIRYGQVGSMPVRRFFPWFAVEDRRYHCLVGGVMESPASWQMEVYSRDDRPAISGGSADREFGHWMKSLQPEEIIRTPTAFLSTTTGDLDELCNRLKEPQRIAWESAPKSEKELPIIFNEFCASWGNPTEDSVRRQAAVLKGKGISYFVIDCGWYADPEKGWATSMGDWIPNSRAFPNGLKRAADAVADNGMIPGIWFEAEVCGRDSAIYKQENLLLKRDGVPVSNGERRFFDFRNEDSVRYVREKIFRCLKENGFGYLKVDYNDSIGIGCDGAESLGEGLRIHSLKTLDFYSDLRREFPELVMENCSSGGHRLEPARMALFSMASFSDAHECVSEPIIAANVLRAILPCQSQIWAVLRENASPRRLRYLLAATCLGRMCLSGDIEKLTLEQWSWIDAGISCYRSCVPMIRDGKMYRRGTEILSYAHPEGWQAILFEKHGESAVIVHQFAQARKIQVQFDSLRSHIICERFADKEVSIILEKDGTLHIEGLHDFDALVIRTQQTPSIEMHKGGAAS